MSSENDLDKAFSDCVAHEGTTEQICKRVLDIAHKRYGFLRGGLESFDGKMNQITNKTKSADNNTTDNKPTFREFTEKEEWNDDGTHICNGTYDPITHCKDKDIEFELYGMTKYDENGKAFIAMMKLIPKKMNGMACEWQEMTEKDKENDKDNYIYCWNCPLFYFNEKGFSWAKRMSKANNTNPFHSNTHITSGDYIDMPLLYERKKNFDEQSLKHVFDKNSTKH